MFTAWSWPSRRTTLSLVVAGLLVTTAATGCASSPTKKPGPLVALQSAANDFVRQSGAAPGIIVTFGHGGAVSSLSAGVADLASQAKPQPNDYMRLASVAKAFSGATALSLVARKTLTLDDTIGKWLPYLPKAWSAVTLSQLLAHTSGIPDFSQSQGFRDALGAALQTPPPHRDLLSYIANEKLEFAPGSRYQYSNSDNIAVALMVEAATGRSYESVMAANVLAPLGMKHTLLPNGSALSKPYIHGYDVTTKPPSDITNVVAAGWSWASGGVVSTPADTIRFIQGYVSGATTNAKTRAAQFTFRAGSSEPPGPGTNSAGLAIFRYQTSCGTVYGHTGNTAGYTQFVAATQDGKDAVSVAINGQITPKSNATLFAQLRHIYELAVCAAVPAK